MGSKQFATVVVITFIVGILWLVFDILFNTKASVPENPKLNILLEPINPNFSSRILKIIAEEIPETGSVPITKSRIIPDIESDSSESGGQAR